MTQSLIFKSCFYYLCLVVDFTSFALSQIYLCANQILDKIPDFNQGKYHSNVDIVDSKKHTETYEDTPTPYSSLVKCIQI